MPSIRILLVSVLVILFCSSCSDDDTGDNVPALPLEDVALSFADSLYWIHQQPPFGLWTRDVNSWQALDYLDFVNSVVIGNIQSYLTPVEWTAAPAVDTVVVGKPGVRYRAERWIIYNVGEFSCLVSQQGNKYVFESFVRYASPSWRQAMYAEEQVDRSRGLMKVYVHGTEKVVVDGAWERRNDHFYFILKYPSAKYHEVHLDINEKTGAGAVKHWQDEKHEYDVSWDASGAGAWTRYNADGSVAASGKWEADA